MELINLVVLLTCMLVALSAIFASKLKSLEDRIDQLQQQIDFPKKKDT